MRFDSEKEIEDIIYNTYVRTGELVIDGSRPDVLRRQFNLGGYGVADLVAFYADRNFRGMVNAKIFELKNGKVTVDAISQVCRYRTGLTQALDLSEEYCPQDVLVAVVGMSVADCAAHVLNSADVMYYETKINPVGGVSFVGVDDGWDFDISSGAATDAALDELFAVAFGPKKEGLKVV